VAGQVKHHWIDWNEFAENHIRKFVDRDDWRPQKPQAIHKIIRSYGINASRGVEYHYTVEFQEPLTDGRYPNGRLAQSNAQFVFPKLHFPRWHRPGGSMVIVRHPGVMRWLNESLTAPLLGIMTSTLLYVTMDDPDEFSLIKMRCEEYREE
jgi:hypothetical protein